MPYIYNADTYCESCGQSICEDILSELSEDEQDQYDDERSYDSSEFPKYMSSDEESDSPCHCGSHESCLEAEILPDGTKIGALLSTNLTQHGVDYVKECVAEGGLVADFWRDRFSWIDWSEDQEEESNGN